MSLASRNKGKRGEREVINMLQPIVDMLCKNAEVERIVLERDLMQSGRGGHDVVGLPGLAIEVKNCKTLALESWWKQTLQQAGSDKEPILFYKVARVGWRVRARLLVMASGSRARVIADIDLAQYLTIFASIAFREILEHGKTVPADNQ
jgi:hypothetical protein